MMMVQNVLQLLIVVLFIVLRIVFNVKNMRQLSVKKVKKLFLVEVMKMDVP